MMLLATIAFLGTGAFAPQATPNLAPCDGSAWCGFDRPEDISVVPGTLWIVVTDQAQPVPLQLVDMTNPTRRVTGTLVPQVEPQAPFDCGGPPDTFAIRGHDVRKVGNRFELAVVNQSRIEIFNIVAAPYQTTLQWIGCVDVPSEYMLNDLAFADDGTLYGSHMFSRITDRESAAALQQSFLDRANTGYAVTWSRGAGWRKVEETDVSFANGIAISRDQKTLAVAGTYSKKIILLDLASGKTIERSLPLQPDNITVSNDGSFLVTGHTGTPLRGVDPCRPAHAFPCGFPFAVGRVYPDLRFDVVMTDDGTATAGASVAAFIHDKTLLLGSGFGDGLAVRIP